MNQLPHMQTDYLSGLNEQQLDAVLCPARIIFTSSGPGTGKTKMLTSKLVYEIEQSQSLQSIVALSYTNTAANQLGERFYKMFNESGIEKKFNIFSGTIHSFCFRMIKEYYHEFQYIILDDEELHELAKDIRESLGGNISTELIMDILKSDTHDVSSALCESVCKIKESLKIIAIKDILLMFLNALEDEQFQEWIRPRITMVAVDEAQDLCELNYQILDKLLEIIPDMKLFLVGDPRQNIFEFNGGSYKNLYDFLEKHPDHEVKTLTITYRCTQAIADYVNTFQFTDCENYQLQSQSQNPGSIDIEPNLSEDKEAEKVIWEVLKVGNLEKCAVICNNLKYLSVLISQLQKKEIPYKVFGGRKLLKKHIRYLNHILRVIDSDNAYSIRKVAQYADIDIVQDGKRKKSLFYASPLGQELLSIRQMASSSFLEIAHRVIALVLTEDDTGEQRIDYSAFLDISKQYNSISDYLAAFATDREQFSQFYYADYEECPIPIDKGYLTISTIHSAKGLEWENVFIMGLCEGNFPNAFFCQEKTPEEQEEFFNGEWKKMYVASTRAKEKLHLTYSSTIKRKGYSFHKSPSRFIAYGDSRAR